MKNVLFLVHVEEMFRQHFPDEMYVNRLIRACTCRKYDEIYICVSGVCDYEPIPEVANVTEREQWIDWGWGYEKGQFEDPEGEDSWIIHAYGHEWTWIPPELRNNDFHSSNVFVGGGCESECLEDWCNCLEYLEIEYKKIRGYIY